MAQVLTVAQVNRYIKELFAKDFALNRVTVSGEVSNCKYHSTGHIYFTLKDDTAALDCVMFAGNRASLSFRLENGQQIEASGQVTVYEKTGSYSLYVRSCVLSGAGQLYERFLRLKEELSAMGMFDPMYKKPIPPYCRRIGIVTSPTGAAIRDIESVSKRRNPYVELILCPALVQGDGAPESIVRGIKRLDGMKPDCIIVGRGGGSIEDLWAFNDERVAQAIFDASTPIISAVGHQTDFTIADFVADVRAATPSAAAELANFEYAVLEQNLEACRSTLLSAVMLKLMTARSSVGERREQLNKHSPAAVTAQQRLKLSEQALGMRHIMESRLLESRSQLETCSAELENAMASRLKDVKNQLAVKAAQLDGLSPLKKISGGYGYIESSSGSSVRSVADICTGELLCIYVQDGRINARAESAERLEYK